VGDHRGVSREELKHGAVVALTVLLALGLVAAWSVLIPGFVNWDDIVLAVIGSLRLTGPVAAAFAAWVAVGRRAAWRGQTPTPWRAVKAPLAILAIVIGAFGGAVLVLGLRVMDGTTGRLLPGGLTMCVAGLALYVVVGWTVGWLVPLVIAPAIAGAGTFALFSWLATGWAWSDRLTPTAREPYDLFKGIDEAALADQTLWLLGLSAALLLGWVALVTRKVLAVAAAGVAVLAAGAGAARLVAEPRTITASERMAHTCQEWPITVCVHPAMRGRLAELASVFTTLAARLADTPAAFRRVEQRPVSERGDTPPGVVVIHADELGPGYAERTADEFLNRLIRPCRGRAAAGYRNIVVAWLRDRPLPAGPLPEHRYAAVWFSQLTEAQRRTWLGMYYSDFVACTLQARHFGGGARSADPYLADHPAHPSPPHTPAYPVDPAPGYPPSRLGSGYPGVYPTVSRHLLVHPGGPGAPGATGPAAGSEPRAVTPR